MPSERWRFAQKYELPYQLGKISHPEIINIEIYGREYARQFEEFLNQFIKITDNTRILEIGCGPTGIIFFMNSGKRFGIDPLFDSYYSNFKSVIDFERISCAKSIGEKLPFKEESFDIVLIHNVLDHTDNPQRVVEETKRVLKKDGIVYIGINTYSLLVHYAHKVYELIWRMCPESVRKRMLIPVFWSHPNIMREGELIDLVSRSGLKVIYTKSRSKAEAKNIFRSKRKGIFWYIVSIFMYSGGFSILIAQK